MQTSVGGVVSGLRGCSPTLPARLGQRSNRATKSTPLVCRSERKRAAVTNAAKSVRTTDTPNVLAVPVAAAALAGFLLSSAVVMPEEAYAARSSGRVGGSSFRSAAPRAPSRSAMRSQPSRGAPPPNIQKPRGPMTVPRLPRAKRTSVPQAERITTPKTVPKSSFNSVRPFRPSAPAPSNSLQRASESLRSNRVAPALSSGGGGGNSYRGGNTYNSYTVAPSIGGYGGGYYPGGFGGGITVFPSFYSPPVMGVALPLGVIFNLTFTLLVVGAAFAVVKSIFSAVTRGGGGGKKDEWD